jgi:hypothetical protein
MSERAKTVAEIEQECRRFAFEIRDPEAARILYRLADDLEQQAREVDRRAFSPGNNR